VSQLPIVAVVNYAGTAVERSRSLESRDQSYLPVESGHRRACVAVVASGEDSERRFSGALPPARADVRFDGCLCRELIIGQADGALSRGGTKANGWVVGPAPKFHRGKPPSSPTWRPTRPRLDVSHVLP